MKAVIQFTKGVEETSFPNIILTRSQDGSTGTATFRFENPTIFYKTVSKNEPITGMYLIDDEGILLTRNIQINYVNGKPKKIEAIYIMKNRDAWDRFMRFVKKYSKINGLTFTKADSNQL